MRRRDFITLLGGTAIWPLAAHAQQAVMPVIGFLRSTPLAVSTPMIAGFRQGLTAAGFNEGQNVAIEYRYADDQLERLPGLVAELIRLPVAVIVANVNAALAVYCCAFCASPPLLFAPVLFCLTLDGRRCWVLALDPMGRAAGAVARVLALRNDAFTSEQASVLEHERPIFLELCIEHEAASGFADEPT